jgi:hypothetical protein
VETLGFHPQNRLREPGSRKKTLAPAENFQLWQKISSSGRFVKVQHFMEALSLFFTSMYTSEICQQFEAQISAAGVLCRSSTNSCSGSGKISQNSSSGAQH